MGCGLTDRGCRRFRLQLPQWNKRRPWNFPRLNGKRTHRYRKHARVCMDRAKSIFRSLAVQHLARQGHNEAPLFSRASICCVASWSLRWRCGASCLCGWRPSSVSEHLLVTLYTRKWNFALRIWLAVGNYLWTTKLGAALPDRQDPPPESRRATHNRK
jgi:hypothetical protein